jgi:hypothetical protein
MRNLMAKIRERADFCVNIALIIKTTVSPLNPRQQQWILKLLIQKG